MEIVIKFLKTYFYKIFLMNIFFLILKLKESAIKDKILELLYSSLKDFKIILKEYFLGVLKIIKIIKYFRHILLK